MKNSQIGCTCSSMLSCLVWMSTLEHQPVALFKKNFKVIHISSTSDTNSTVYASLLAANF